MCLKLKASERFLQTQQPVFLLPNVEELSSDSQAVLSGEPTGGSVSAVESVLQVNACLSYEVVPSYQVMVIDQQGQQRLLRKGCLHLKRSGRRKDGETAWKWVCTTLKHGGKLQSASYVPSKHRIQLFRNVVVSVFDFVLAEPENNVRVSLPILVSWVQVRCLGREERL